MFGGLLVASLSSGSFTITAIIITMMTAILTCFNNNCTITNNTIKIITNCYYYYYNGNSNNFYFILFYNLTNCFDIDFIALLYVFRAIKKVSYYNHIITIIFY